MIFEQDPSLEAEGVSYADDVEEDSTNDPTSGTPVGFVKERFKRAETARDMKKDADYIYRNYRGIYGPDVRSTFKGIC